MAVRGVSFQISAGDTLGLVGKSGCGKSTVALSILRLVEPASGSVHSDGMDVASLGRGDLRRLRKRIQMALRDPLSSLSPHRTVRASIREPLEIHSTGTPKEREDLVDGLLERVGLDRTIADRYPSQLSGGQNQRVSTDGGTVACRLVDNVTGEVAF